MQRMGKNMEKAHSIAVLYILKYPIPLKYLGQHKQVEHVAFGSPQVLAGSCLEASSPCHVDISVEKPTTRQLISPHALCNNTCFKLLNIGVICYIILDN